MWNIQFQIKYKGNKDVKGKNEEEGDRSKREDTGEKEEVVSPSRSAWPCQALGLENITLPGRPFGSSYKYVRICFWVKTTNR